VLNAVIYPRKLKLVNLVVKMFQDLEKERCMATVTTISIQSSSKNLSYRPD